MRNRARPWLVLLLIGAIIIAGALLFALWPTATRPVVRLPGDSPLHPGGAGEYLAIAADSPPVIPHLAASLLRAA